MKSKTYHCRQRAKERYGLELNSGHIAMFNDNIRRQKYTYLGRISNTITDWLITYKSNVKLIARYSSSKHRIVTFLPKNSIEYGEII